jgi:hypothetical protein
MQHRFVSPVLALLCVIGLSLPGVAGQAQVQDPPRSQPPAGSQIKGPISPDIDPKALWDGRKMAPFHSLDMPNMVKAAEADFLGPDEYILGVTVNGASRAYPTRFIWWHHVVNDKISTPDRGESYFAVTYCSVCNTGIRYDLAVDGKAKRLDFFGLYNGVVTLCDRESESVFLQASGKFVTGPLLGKQLKTGSILDTTWSEWRHLHPDTLVMSPDTAYSRYYRSKDQAEPRGYDRFPAPYFRPTVTRGDKRLPPFDKVLGVTLQGKDADGGVTEGPLFRAYPIKGLQDAGNVINDMLGTVPVAVLFNPVTVAASAVSRKIDGKTLTFEARKVEGKPIAFYDKETGSRWSIEGKGEEGPLAGKTLERLDNHLSQWYGWYAYFPETTIYGRSDPAQPGDPFDTPVEAKPAPEDKKP